MRRLYSLMPISSDQDYRNFHWSKRLAVEIIIVAIIGLIMGFLGPFGTYEMPSGIRLAYWVIFSIIGYVIFRPITYVAQFLREIIDIPEWLAELLGCMLAAIPFTFLIIFIMSGLKWDVTVINERYGLLYLQCLAIGFGIYLFMANMFSRNAMIKSTVKEAVQDNIRTKLHERLPAGFPEHIDALHAEDHYVHVYADGHKEMLLMRMSDAIKEIDNIDGCQIHRSWWVAHHAVNTSKRDGPTG